MACDELRKAGQPVGDAFDRSEPRRARTNRGEKGGQNCGCGFVAPVAEQAGEADTKYRAVEPGLFFRAFTHEEAVYRCELAVTKRRSEATMLCYFFAGR